MKRMITTILLTLILMMRLTAPATSYCYITAGEVVYDSSLLNWFNIEREINRLGILEPDKLMLQIRLESGNLTSRICKECNNLIGMKKAVKRKTTAIGREKNGIAIYRNWQDSLLDYKLWQDYFYKGGDYYQFLHERYATDVYYVIKLKRL